jgi:F420-0:gamma-glutamyl ligase
MRETTAGVNVDYGVLNAVLRGIISAHGAGGGITGEVVPVRINLQITSYENLLADAARAICNTGIEDGDIVVLTSSVVALAQGRTVPFGTIPKNSSVRNEIPALMSFSKLEEYARLISETQHLSCTVRDILLSDTIAVDGQLVLLLGPEQPNDVAFDLATLLKENQNVNCDVVLKDSDAGGSCGNIVVGHPTLVATPLGATKGLSILEAMRVAAAGEALMGKKNGIPVVLCRPANAVVRDRHGMGERRTGAFLDATSEPLLSSHDERR